MGSPTTETRTVARCITHGRVRSLSRPTKHARWKNQGAHARSANAAPTITGSPYCDVDFNRHVNSSRYIELLLVRWSLDFHDRNRLTRFEKPTTTKPITTKRWRVRLADDPSAEV